MKSDSQGFIIGNKQLEQLNRGIHRIDLNVEQILSLLLDTQSSKIGSTVVAQNKTTNVVQENLAQQKQNTYTQNKNNTRQARALTQQAKQIKQHNERLTKAEQAIIAKQKAKTTHTPELKNERLRNAKGQFVKSDGSNADVGKSTGSRESNLPEMGVNIPQGLDPTLDAISEITDVTSSIANKFSWLKRLKFWRNREKHQREERRLLRLLLGKLNPKKGMGFLSGLFGGGGSVKGSSKVFKFLGKLLKRIPLLGALLGGGLLLSQWKDLDTVGKGKAIGELGGGLAGGAVGAVVGTMVFPVVGTVIGGLLGAWLGSEAGESIGGAIAPHFKSFTSKSLATWRSVNQNFLANLGRVGQFVMTSFNAVVDSFTWVKDGLKSAFDGTVKFISDIFTGIVDRIKQALSFVPNVVNTGQSLYEKAVDGASSLIEKTVNFFGGGSAQNSGQSQAIQQGGISTLANKIGNSIATGRQLAKQQVGDISRYCALVIRHSLNSIGIKGTFGHGSQVAGNLLRQHSDKFEQVKWDKNYVPMKGDIMSIDSKDAHNAKRHNYQNYGHVAIFDGKQWVSQFNQGHLQGKYGNTIAINDGYYKGMLNGTNKVTIARPKGSTTKPLEIKQPQVKTPTTQALKQATPIKASSPVINTQVPTLKQAKLSQAPKPPTESFQVSSHTIKVSVNPSQVGQNVSHQDLAHIITGGFGNNQREQV